MKLSTLKLFMEKKNVQNTMGTEYNIIPLLVTDSEQGCTHVNVAQQDSYYICCAKIVVNNHDKQ